MLSFNFLSLPCTLYRGMQIMLRKGTVTIPTSNPSYYETLSLRVVEKAGNRNEEKIARVKGFTRGDNAEEEGLDLVPFRLKSSPIVSHVSL